MGITHFSGPVDSAAGYRENNIPLTGYSYVYEDFRTNATTSLATGGLPSGAANTLNVLSLGRNNINYVAKGTQTILAPVLTAAGFNINMDQVDNDGIELGGSVVDRARSMFTIGTSEAFFFSVTFAIATVSGTDDCAIGFRKTQAYQANIDDYTDFAVLNVITGNITIETALNNAATVTTDTTLNWANAETHTLTVKVSKSGQVTYEVDGVTPSTVAAYTFDTGDIVVPYMFFLNAAGIAGAVTLTKWECGLQEVKDLP